MSILGASKWAKQGESGANGKRGTTGDADVPSSSSSSETAAELKKRENELREKMLRQKVIKTMRKRSSTSAGTGGEETSGAPHGSSDD